MTTATIVAARHSVLSTRAALASVALALILLVAKGWAAWATDSTAMLGSLADTALDLVASLDDAGWACASPPSRPTATTALATARPRRWSALAQVVADQRCRRPASPGARSTG